MAVTDATTLAHLQFAAAVGHDLHGLVELARADHACEALGAEIERLAADDVRALLFAACLVLDRDPVRSVNGWELRD